LYPTIEGATTTRHNPGIQNPERRVEKMPQPSLRRLHPNLTYTTPEVPELTEEQQRAEAQRAERMLEQQRADNAKLEATKWNPVSKERSRRFEEEEYANWSHVKK
jgi:hypothetical protein